MRIFLLIIGLLILYTGLTAVLAVSYNASSEEADVIQGVMASDISFRVAYTDSLRDQAMNGDPQSQSYLGWCYLYGLGIKANAAQAEKWLKLAADTGLADGEFRYGWSYCITEGLKASHANQGKPIAGTLNYKKAFFWFQQSAALGNPTAQFCLAQRLFYGQGGKFNKIEALQWYTTAANNGHLGAQYACGECHLNGYGTAKDRLKAYYWFHLAALNGNKAAKSRADSIASGLTMLQKAAQDESADQWITAFRRSHTR